MANTIRNRTVSSSDFLAAAYFAVGWTSEKKHCCYLPRF